MDSSDEMDNTCVEEEESVNNAQAIVEVTIVARRPRAIVVLLGTEIGQLQEYTRIYHNLECCTIVSMTPIVHKQNVATTTCREVARLVRMSEMSEMGYGTVPVLFHVFGNGGAMFLEQVDWLIREWVSEQDLEDLQHQTRVSSCPIPLRTLKPMGSLKSIPSLTSTSLDESDGEDDSPLAKEPLWTPPKKSVSPKRLFPPFDQRRIQPQVKTTSSISHQTTRVRRIDVERRGAVSSKVKTPIYNMEPRAYRMDFSLVASRLFMGSIMFDFAPTNDFASIANPLRRILAKVAGRKMLFSNWRNEGEHVWNTMEQLSLSRRHVFVHSGVDSNPRLKELISLQREKGRLVTECVVKKTDRVERLAQVIEDAMDSFIKKLPTEDDDEDCWTSDDESCNEDEEWYDALEEEETSWVQARLHTQ